MMEKQNQEEVMGKHNLGMIGKHKQGLYGTQHQRNDGQT